MNISRWIANRLPRRVVYHAGIRLWAHATTGQYFYEDAPSLVTMNDCIKRWTD